ncbi:hypothetical protein QEH59_08230 [Coraliomargarita sp. SDUM461004]|uniref:DUF3379 domain-containing protein n=1 Tax=Thalassobacterium sedimentorum TaxID=3041258 RepID=A0ABU1AKP5_9BACT|nr:hypothetical protein [Coraliomargarita sp. SDUM461004]MDQ8194410.1 hypothetical protein [Coraliomargarita sp. SDUM461004]
MNHEEAKQLLELCRPGNQEDREDPLLAEAFARLETDARLKAWFEEQQAIDAQISKSINSITVPADLKASILAGMRLHQAHAADTTTVSSIPFPAEGLPGSTESSPPEVSAKQRAWWQSPWTGIAALFVIMMTVLNVPKSNDALTESTAIAGLPPVIQFLADEIDALSSGEFDRRDHRPEQLQTFLASKQAPFPKSIPNCIKKMPTIGCITYEFKGAKLSMICFKEGEVYHLITADKATYPDALPLEPEVFQCSGKAFKIWVDGEQVKILSVKGTKENIPEFI